MTATLEALVQEIYQDSRVSPGEILKLRKLAEEAEKKVLDTIGYQGTTAALFKSFDVTYQLLQETLLQVRKQNVTEENKKAILLAIEANIQLLKTAVDAFAK